MVYLSLDLMLLWFLRFSYKHRAPSPGLPIYSLAPARAGTGTGSSKAYV